MPELQHESKIDDDQWVIEQDSRLEELGMTSNMDNFIIAARVDWLLTTNKQDNHWKLNASSGTLLNLGQGSWLYNGSASGTRMDGKPWGMPWSFEYFPAEDAIKHSTAIYTTRFEAVSSLTSPVQLRKDISGMPVILIVTKMIDVGRNQGLGSYLVVQNSYVQF